jgi:hypothetical protein
MEENMKLLGRLRPSPAMVVGCIALGVALGGTSVAAIQALPKNSVGTKQLKNGAVTKKKINKKTIAQLRGNRGPRGLQGPQGAQGAQGIQGIQGIQGPPGPLVNTLPAGRTLVGEWSVLEHPTAAGQQFGDAISYQFPLSTAPVAHYIEAGAPTPAGCAGSRTNPGAAPGHLCVFEFETFNAAAGPLICNWLVGSCSGASRLGFTVVPFSAGAGLMETNGTWAVTALAGAGPTPAAPGTAGRSSRPATEAR